MDWKQMQMLAEPVVAESVFFICHEAHKGSVVFFLVLG